MVFSGLTFLYCFLPITLFLYFLTPKEHKNLTLAIASLVFYAWGEPVYILIMLFSISFNFACGLLIEHYTNDKKRKMVLVLSIVINLIVLGIFKYLSFLISNVNNILSINIPLTNISLPIGISFYTFQTMSYSIDVYKKTVPANKSIVDFTAYVSLFPQLIAGPIVRYNTICKQLKSRTINFDKIADGGYRFFCGLAKKVLLANNIGILWNTIKATQDVQWQSAWLGIIAFTMQIYFDFSGYSDMAIGLGKILGFDFLENFNYPYVAKSVTDFWRRWHISLSSWFKDYVYIPLGGNRVNKTKNFLNIMIVWALTGMWHGASWNFICWGIYYGFILIMEKLFMLKIIEKLPNVLRHVYTMIIVIIGWVLFSIESFPEIVSYIKAMFNINFVFDRVFAYNITSYLPMLIIMIIGCTPIPKKIIEKCSFLKPILSIIALILCTAYLVDSTYNPFLYFRF